MHRVSVRRAIVIARLRCFASSRVVTSTRSTAGRFHADVGDLVSVPGGAEHGFVNITNRPARQLIIILPGLDAARFFDELAGVMKDGVPNQFGLNDFGQRWDVEFLGPPLTVLDDQ